LLPHLLWHHPATQKRNPRTLREVRSSLAEVLVLVVVDEDVDVAVLVVVVDVDEVEVAVAGSKLRPTSLLLERSPSKIRIPRKMIIRLLGKRMYRGILFA
jgi:hypothetical protein